MSLIVPPAISERVVTLPLPEHAQVILKDPSGTAKKALQLLQDTLKVTNVEVYVAQAYNNYPYFVLAGPTIHKTTERNITTALYREFKIGVAYIPEYLRTAALPTHKIIS